MAPPDVVAAIAGLLVKRARRAAPESLKELEAARDLLSDDARRREYDEAHGYGDRRAPRNSYETLGVAMDADIGILGVAYSVGMSAKDERVRKLIRAAHRTLGNPYLRARYDLSLNEGSEPSPAPFVQPPAPVVPEEPILARNPAFERRMQQAAPTTDELTPNDSLPAGTAPVDAEISEPVIEPPVVVADEEVRAEIPAFDSSLSVRERLASLRTESEPPREWGSDATHRDHLARLAAAEANTAREMARTTGDESAALQFVDGPRAGQSVAIITDTVTIGCGSDAEVRLRDASADVAPNHARVWRLGARYVLRRLDGDEIIVDGRVLREPAVTLRHGTEIRIGNHQLRFVRIGGADEAPAPGTPASISGASGKAPIRWADVPYDTTESP